MGNWDGRSSSNRFRGNHKYGSRGRRRSHVAFSTRLYKATHGDFNPNIRLYALAGFFVFLSVIGVVLYQSSLFHNYMKNPSYCSVIDAAGNNSCHDPTTPFFDETSSSFASDFSNTLCAATCLATAGTGTESIVGWRLQSNSTFASVVITKSPFSISTVNGKEFGVVNGWSYNPSSGTTATSCTNCATFGWFLRRGNGTIPLTQGYDPINDVNVAALFRATPQSTTQVYNQFFIQRNPLNSIASDNGQCSSPTSSCFTDFSFVNVGGGGGNSGDINSMAITLNFTGVSGVSGQNGGNTGRSLVFIANALTQSQKFTLPWLDTTSSYYLGFYMLKCCAVGSGNSPMQVLFYIDTSNSAQYNLCENVAPDIGCAMYTGSLLPTPPASPLPTQPTIDTGGFFGPVIRALISIGVFMGQNIITFFQFLFNLLGPLISNAINSLATLMTNIFNAIGGVFGYNTLGTQLVGLVADFGSFLTNSFRNLTGIVGNIVTFINNAATFITQFFTNSSFTNLLFGEIGALVNIWTVINGIWGDFAKWFVAGTLSIAAILEIDWVLGTLWTAVEGWKGFREWLDLNELIIIRLFALAYWMFELGLDVAFKLIMIIKGRVLWFQVLAEG